MTCIPPCGKTRYPDRYRALLACIKLAMQGGPLMEPYRAESCRCWHLTGHHNGRLRRGRTIRKMEGYRDDYQET